METRFSLGRRRLAVFGLVSLAFMAFLIPLVRADQAAAATPACKNPFTFSTGAGVAVAYALPQVLSGNGLLKRQCLRLTTTPVAGPGILFAQVISGQLNLGLLGTITLPQALQAKLKIKVIAPANGPGDFSFCVAKDGPIRSIKDLQGKTYGTSLIGSTPDIGGRVTMARAGVNLATVKVVQVPNPSAPQLLLNGTIAAYMCAEPAQTIYANKIRVLDRNPMAKVFGKNMVFSYQFVTEDFYNKHRPEIVRYQKAYLAGSRLAAKSPAVIRRQAQYLLHISRDVADKMHVFTVPQAYNIPSVMRQMRVLKQFGAIKEVPSERDIRAMFVPLPGQKTVK